MSGFVVDASVAAAWCLEDEASPEGDALLERLREETGVVPDLWFYEVGNLLMMAERRKRIDMRGLRQRLALLAELPIEIDDESPVFCWPVTLDLARAEALSVYDAAYLELALRRKLPLATRDRELLAAAARRKAAVLTI